MLAGALLQVVQTWSEMICIFCSWRNGYEQNSVHTQIMKIIKNSYPGGLPASGPL